MTQSNTRSSIMAKLRREASGLSADQIANELQSLGRAPIASLPVQELCEAFLTKVLLNQGTVDCVANRSEAVKAIADYLHEKYRTRKIVAGNDPRLAAMPWRDGGVLPRFGAADQGESISLSYANLGIAETGSTLIFTGKHNPAANNLLVEDHVVLIDVNDLVENMDQAWEKINPGLLSGARPRGINIISGPSSTADIEAQLVMGAHGPRRWHVVLMGDVPDAALNNARSAIEMN